jgi:hypothetical protein
LYSYGFTHNNTRCAFWVGGDVKEGDGMELWTKIFNDSRWKPGQTEVIGMLDQMVDTDPFYVKMMMDVVASNKPKKLGVVIFDYLSLEAAHQGASFLRDMNIPSRVFTDLDELFHWMENSE